jgi:hypothetical protein
MGLLGDTSFGARLGKAYWICKDIGCEYQLGSFVKYEYILIHS